ncbi:hypothetical protein CASFOL_036706 [Castilleja foliolosa]|uniref:BRX domain-containing protein n=1 Tax=Castilleja foliolosa TaxID=1961234 RepID=A0ABD3BQ69_9LAMI
MLTCITCSKQKSEDGEESPRGTPNTKDAVKSLTTQIKDMALKVSGGSSSSSSSKCNKPGGNFKSGQRSYPEFDTISEGVPYDPYNAQTARSSSSTQAWDYARTSQHHRPVPRFSTSSSQFGDVMLEEEDEPKEWTAQVEPGVQITFVSLPRGGNDLKRIRFSRDMFDKFQAQRWWGENFDRIKELYNVQKFNQQDTPGRSEDGRDSVYSRLGCALESPRMTPSLNKEWTPRYNNNNNYYNGAGTSGGPRASEMEASRMTTSSRDEASVSISNASDIDSEWIEEDEPGVYITIRQLMDGTRELRRVRFTVKNLEKCMRKTGGKLTGIGYKLNIFASNKKNEVIT